eukprot:3115235-Alexandrium_andersonii.AAC.1
MTTFNGGREPHAILRLPEGVGRVSCMGGPATSTATAWCCATPGWLRPPVAGPVSSCAAPV